MNPGSMHGPTAVAMAAGDPQQQHIQVQCTPNCVCSGTLHRYPIPSNGPQRSLPQNNFRQHLYTRQNTNTTSRCPVCQQFGHTESTCWQMALNIDMSFVHQALKEWNKSHKRIRIEADKESKQQGTKENEQQGAKEGEKQGTKEDEQQDAKEGEKQDEQEGTLSSNPLLTLYGEHYERLKLEYGIQEMKLDIMNAVDEEDPKSWRQAMASPNKAFWLKAAYDEMSAITGMCTFDLASEVPDGRRPLATKWVWNTKRNIKGDIEKFKARWVARGDLQKKRFRLQRDLCSCGEFSYFADGFSYCGKAGFGN